MFNVYFARILIGIFLISLISFLVFKYIKVFQHPKLSYEMVYPVNKTIRYGFSVKNITDEPLNNARFVTFAPIPHSASQKLLSLKSNLEFIEINDVQGNRQLSFTIPKLAPYGSIDIVITAELVLASKPNKEALSQLQYQYYLQPEKYIESASQEVSDVAKQFSDASHVPRSIYQWLVKNLTDIGFTAKDRGAKYALSTRQGDCTEYMYSFVALARHLDIPSRGVAGFRVSNSSRLLKASNYHNWAEYHDGERWRVADPQQQNFDQNYTTYVAFRQISIKEQTPMSNAERFIAHDSRLLIKMN